MTELMKRYEAETGDNSQLVWHGGSFASDDYIAWLEAQLTWRPVSEKPAIETEEVLIRKEMRLNGKDIVTIQPIKMNTIGDWGQYVAKLGVSLWLPIPPAPEA